MSQQNVRRFATVGALALLLFMAGAGSAQARDLRAISGPLGWFQAIWSQGVSVVGSWYGASAAPGRNLRSAKGMQKEGLGVDPNGANSSGPVCLGCSDEGLGVDPNGSK
jgi:hypothetical protein